MKKTILLLALPAAFMLFSSFAPSAGKLVSSKTHISFFSHTAVEDIQANNYAAVSTIDSSTGEVVFSVPMQGFEFEKALMQKHFNNSDFLDTKAHPKAKLIGQITNLNSIDFEKDGTYQATVEGELTIKGVTKKIQSSGSIKVSGTTVNATSKFEITLADYGITFVKGKPASNIAKTVEITVHAEYQPKK